MSSTSLSTSLCLSGPTKGYVTLIVRRMYSHADPFQEEVRLTTETLAATLLSVHFDAISSCWNEVLSKSPIQEKVHLVSFLIQLRSHFPLWRGEHFFYCLFMHASHTVPSCVLGSYHRDFIRRPIRRERRTRRASVCLSCTFINSLALRYHSALLVYVWTIHRR